MKKNLKWRLGKLPTPEEVLRLIENKIITQDEARAIFFTEETEEDADIEALKKEIEFLRQLVNSLANRSQIQTVIHEYEKPYNRYNWYKPYEVWCSAQNTMYTTTANDITLASGTNTIGAAYSTSEKGDIKFTSIKTF